jgi:pimeloyl-ACP methyl ester carboxylesterase
MAIGKQQVIRFVLGQGGKVFPGLAARAGFELFCRTDNPRKPNSKQKHAILRAAPLMAQARLHRLKIGRGCVAAHEFRPQGRERGRILVLHGWRSRTDFMAQMIVFLVKEGWRVVGLDLPGHGQSYGRRLTVRLGVEAVAQASEWLGPFNTVIGHSFGGIVAVNAAIGGISGFEPIRFTKLAVISSPNSFPELFSDLGDAFGFDGRARAAMGRVVEKVAGNPVPFYVLANQVKQFKGEVLSIHAPDDKEVAYRDGQAIGEAGGHVRHVAVDGSGHRRIVNDPRVLKALSQFVAEDINSQACAA